MAHCNVVSKIELVEDLDIYTGQSSKLCNFWYLPIKEIVDYLCDKYKDLNNVLEIGPGVVPFPLATVSIGYNEKIKEFKTVDIDTTRFPFEDNQFSFSYCRHVLEDIQNPDFAINEIFRTSRSGYIETPSPLVEITKGVDTGTMGVSYCGYIHHRYIIWSYLDTVYFLPKYPIIEHLISDPKLTSILDNYPIYWNNYILWEKPMKTVIYKNGVNMEIRNDYLDLLNKAVWESMANTNLFIKNTPIFTEVRVYPDTFRNQV
jgi:hypothetical protein